MIEQLVLYEDNHLLALNKPGGLLAQGDRTGDITLVDQAQEYLRIKYGKPGNVFVGLVHRLDRPVSGVILLTKTSKALTRMNKLFSSQQVKKSYWAMTSFRPPSESGTLVHWLKKDPAKNLSSVFKKEVSGARRCELDYQLISVRKKKYLVEVLLKTGRPHQIRAQLSAMGCPITGDLKYGYKGNSSEAIALHARSLFFEHPVKKEPLLIEASLPETDYWQEFH